MYKAMAPDQTQPFIDQFDWEGDDAIYRANRVGTAYRLSLDEYQSFLSAFENGSRRFFWAMVLVVLAAGAGFLVFAPGVTSRLGSVAGTVLFAAAWMVRWSGERWLLLAPARALRSRTPWAMALSGDDRLDRTLGDRNWGALIAEVVLFALMLAFLLAISWGAPTDGRAAPEITGLLMLSLCAVMIVVTLVTMARKWMLEHRRRNIGAGAAS